MDARRLVFYLRLEARDGELERMLQLLFKWGVVAYGSAALDAAGGGNRSRFCQQRLGQAGLAAACLADERECPDALDRICHGASSSVLLIARRPRSGKACRGK